MPISADKESAQKSPTTAFLQDEHRLQKSAVVTVQLLFYPLMLLLRIVLVRNGLRRHPALRIVKKQKDAVYILYGNHQSRLDPMIISASLPFTVALRLMPFRVMVANEHLTGWLGRIFRMIGGFPAHAAPKSSFGLDRARIVLASGQTLILFPPGMRTRKRIARTGISVLATEPNVHFIPVHIDWQSRYRCEVHIGQPFQGGKPQAPDYYMNIAYRLAL